MTKYSKSQTAFFRKLYLAYLIDSGKQNLISLGEKTGMPRRTIQTAMEGFPDVGIDCVFVQDGDRNRHGHYRINDWGPTDKAWIEKNLQYVIDVLQKGSKLTSVNQLLKGENDDWK